jgi:hypothetical protein
MELGVNQPKKSSPNFIYVFDDKRKDCNQHLNFYKFMKKLVFSAIALVAFSSASMANTTIEEKNVNLEQFFINDCETIASIAVSIAEEEYMLQQAKEGVKEPKCFDSKVHNMLFYAYLEGCK